MYPVLHCQFSFEHLFCTFWFVWNFHVNKVAFNLQGKDEVYDRMLLDYFFSYHQFIHLLCRVAINCEKFTETLVKMSKYDGEPVCRITLVEVV